MGGDRNLGNDWDTIGIWVVIVIVVGIAVALIVGLSGFVGWLLK